MRKRCTTAADRFGGVAAVGGERSAGWQLVDRVNPEPLLTKAFGEADGDVDAVGGGRVGTGRGSDTFPRRVDLFLAVLPLTAMLVRSAWPRSQSFLLTRRRS
jgi:hypothetical protein